MHVCVFVHVQFLKWDWKDIKTEFVLLRLRSESIAKRKKLKHCCIFLLYGKTYFKIPGIYIELDFISFRKLRRFKTHKKIKPTVTKIISQNSRKRRVGVHL